MVAKHPKSKIFYVYIYFDPRIKSRFVYKKLKFDYEPFYVGLGHDNRKFSHFDEAKRKKKKNSHKLNKIRKIIREGYKPIIEVFKGKLSFEGAIEQEIKLIKKIGRRNIGTGPLTNMTDGGEGMIGYKHDKKTKSKISKSFQKYIRNLSKKEKEEFYQSRRKAWLGKHHSKKTRLQMSAAQKGKRKSKKACEAMKEAWKKRSHKFPRSVCRKMSKSRLGIMPWNYGKHLPRVMKKKLSDALKGKPFTEKHKKNISKGLTGRHFSEEHKRNLWKNRKRKKLKQIKRRKN